MNLTLPHGYKQLTNLCIAFLLLNVAVIWFFDIEISRLIRVITTFTLFLYFIYRKGYWQKFVFTAFVLFLLRDLLIVQYEIEFYKTAAFLLTLLAYLLLTWITLPKIKLSKSTPVIIIFVLSLIALNVFNVYYLSDVIKLSLDNNFQFALFFVQGAVLILLSFVAFMYNERFEGKTPLVYLYLVLCFILSDLSGLAAYFFKAEAAYFPERVFYIIGLVLLVNFTLNKNAQKEQNIKDTEKQYLL